MNNREDMVSIIRGKCWVLGNDINTDQIIATRHMLLDSTEEMGKHAFESLITNFRQDFRSGDIIVGGENFGYGSAREQAPVVLKVIGVGAIVASNFNPIFFRNCVNIGLPVYICKSINQKISNNDIIEIRIQKGHVSRIGDSRIFKLTNVPAIIQEIISCSGLVGYYKMKYQEEHETTEKR